MAKHIGTNRHVIFFFNFVIKIPRLSAWWEWNPSWDRFKENLISSQVEISNIRKYKGKPGIPKLYFGDRFGLLVIMKRYREIKTSEQYVELLNRLIETSDLPFEFWDNDACRPNFALDENNQIVKIDLG